jgi:predicted hotdog family 3-hydroxylacyl-ACP dehydratase
MILIDAVHEDGAHGLIAVVRIAEDSPFYAPPLGVPGHVGIEYIAQTVGALVGLESRRAGRKVDVGFLLGTRRYRAHRPYFPLGALLEIRVEPEFRSGGLARYAGTIVTEAGEQIVQTSVTLYSGQLQGAHE